MRLTNEKLAAQLARDLAPIYLITGDEPFLQQQAADAVRLRAREQGYDERELLFVERGFDWNALGAAAGSMSLFAERRLLELRMSSAAPGTAGSKALVAYADRPPEDTVLLITMPKIDSRSRNAKWVKTLEAAGVMVQVWPLRVHELPQWVERRMHERGLVPEAAAAQLIAERAEGNLLAADQEMTKLLLQHGEGPVSAAQVRTAVSDGARFDVFQLADAALAGDADRALRILHGLRAEGVDPVLANWSLARDLRTLVKLTGAVASGAPLSSVYQQDRVWENRRPLFKQALSRHKARALVALLERSGEVDLMIKGRRDGDPWGGMAVLAAGLAGALRGAGGGRRAA